MSVRLSWDVSRSAIDAPDGTHLIVMARLHAPRPEGVERAPLNLSLVLDRSGSMTGAKLEHCKHAAGFVVSHLAPTDHLSVVAFDTAVSVVVPPAPVVGKDRVRAAIAGIEATGSTNLSGGWLEGASHVERARRDGTVSRVLLLTDGQANHGVTEPRALMAIGQGLREKGVNTTCIGFGSDFAEDLLRGIADASGGNFHYIESPEQASEVFARELQELLQVAAQNVKLRVAPAQGARLVGVLNDYPTHPLPGGVEIDLGDLMAGDEKTVLIELAGVDAGGVSVLTLTFQQVLGEVAFRELSAFVEAAGDTAVNPVVWREVLLCETAREMLKARDEADAGKLDAARDRLRKASGSLAESPFSDDADFREQRTRLDGLTRLLETRDAYVDSGRKSLSYSSVSLSRSKSFVQALSAMAQLQMERLSRFGVITGPGLYDTGTGAWEETLRRLRADGPTTGHRRIREWRDRRDVRVVTFAVDGLHREAGTDAVEMRGSLWRGWCSVDGRVRPVGDGALLCECGAALAPDVWNVVPDAAWTAARERLADVEGLILVGFDEVDGDLARLIEGHAGPLLWIGLKASAGPTQAIKMPAGPQEGIAGVSSWI